MEIVGITASLLRAFWNPERRKGRPMTDSEYITENDLSLGTDYVGWLNGELRDLQGFDTLIYELIQNADDAPGATTLSFDVDDDALVVRNNGYFSACDDLAANECPWLLGEKGHRCDFHRFRRSAGADKRRMEARTTGAFGIGFVSVYQITDRPELLTADRHWTLQPELEEHKRIRQRVRTDRVDGTTFRLPWAVDANSAMRKGLQLAPIQKEDKDRFYETAQQVIPEAMLFLQKIKHITLTRARQASQTYERQENATFIRVGETQWSCFQMSFEEEVTPLREALGDLIESKRLAVTRIAFLQDNPIPHGRFFVTLPTQHSTALPLHINSDFFPTKARKQLATDQTYQGQWNRAAVRAAATLLVRELPQLPSLLKHERLWELFDAMESASREANDVNPNLDIDYFWSLVRPAAKVQAVVFTSTNEWRPPADVLHLRNWEEEKKAIPLLEQLGLGVVHPDLKSYHNLLLQLGVPILTAQTFANALYEKSATVATPCQRESAPEWIRTEEALRRLDQEIAVLFNRTESTTASARITLLKCAIAPTEDGFITAPSQLLSLSDHDRTIFSALQCRATFLAFDAPAAIADLVPPLTPEHAINILETCTAEHLNDLCRTNPAWFSSLLEWFRTQHGILKVSTPVWVRLKSLPIWPSQGELYPLTELRVPGDFEDPLGVARLLDPELVNQFRAFLISTLTVQTLTITEYASSVIPAVMRQERALDVQARRKILLILADHVHKLMDDPTVWQALQDCELVECSDGVFRRPSDTYFDTAMVKIILGPSIAVARVPEKHGAAVRTFLTWLGVAELPRAATIAEHIAARTSQHPPQHEHRLAIQALFKNISEYVTHSEVTAEEHKTLLQRLQNLAWLPAESDIQNWYYPGEVYGTSFRYLFATRGRFLDIELSLQQEASKFLEDLGVKSTPTATMVVDHLIELVNQGQSIKSLYAWLNQYANDPAIQRLRNVACVESGPNRFWLPSRAYIGRHPFGKYRIRLNDLNKYYQLFKQLGVQDEPTAQDAIHVLRDISNRFAQDTTAFNPAESIKVAWDCWELLNDGIARQVVTEAEIREQLHDQRVIPTSPATVALPSAVFFGDRPRLADIFRALLETKIISRDEQSWRAQRAAGVQSLSEVVSTSLAECEDREEAAALTDRLRKRQGLVRRIMQGANEEDWNLNLLNRIKVFYVSNLAIRYSVTPFLDAPSLTVPDEAYYEPSTDHLYVTKNPSSWTAFARELAYALNPSGNAGQIAAGLKEIFSPASIEDAAMSLDHLGYVTLDTSRVSIPSIDEAQEIETEAYGDDQYYQPHAPSGAEQSSDQSMDITRPNQEPSPSLPTHYAPFSYPSKRGNGATGGNRPRHPGGSLERLRSYVKDSASGPWGTSERQSQQNEVDEAGIAAVIKFEREQGRTTEVMEHNHPGYDIKSKDDSQKVLRYIEVKSLRGEWSSLGVGLSDRQFNTGQSLNEMYWLYVVEFALRPDRRITRIQNPAQRVSQFFYDDGWRDVAELDDGDEQYDF